MTWQTGFEQRIRWSRRLLAVFYGLVLAVWVGPGAQLVQGEETATAHEESLLWVVLLASLTAALVVTLRRNAKVDASPLSDIAASHDIELRIARKTRQLLAVASGRSEAGDQGTRALFRLRSQVRRWRQRTTSGGEWTNIGQDLPRSPQLPIDRQGGDDPPAPAHHDPWSAALEEVKRREHARRPVRGRDN